MRRKVGDLVWIPEKATLLWALKEEKLIKRMKITASPNIALIVSEFDEDRYCIFLNNEYWTIDKSQVYDIPETSKLRNLADARK